MRTLSRIILLLYFFGSASSSALNKASSSSFFVSPELGCAIEQGPVGAMSSGLPS
jgi:hypothetical protein